VTPVTIAVSVCLPFLSSFYSHYRQQTVSTLPRSIGRGHRGPQLRRGQVRAKLHSDEVRNQSGTTRRPLLRLKKRACNDQILRALSALRSTGDKGTGGDGTRITVDPFGSGTYISIVYFIRICSMRLRSQTSDQKAVTNPSVDGSRNACWGCSSLFFPASTAPASDASLHQSDTSASQSASRRVLSNPWDESTAARRQSIVPHRDEVAGKHRPCTQAVRLCRETDQLLHCFLRAALAHRVRPRNALNHIVQAFKPDAAIATGQRLQMFERRLSITRSPPATSLPNVYGTRPLSGA